jgi:hypothetical protein
MQEYIVRYGDNTTIRIEREYDKANISSTQKDKKPPSEKVTSFVRSNLIEIDTFNNLIMEIAELSCKNPDVMLFFRGQTENHFNISTISLKPSIFRKHDSAIQDRFNTLKFFSNKLVEEIKKANDLGIIKLSEKEINEITNIKILQHSILQHYSVCPTPFLDVSQSIKVACTFASLNNEENEGYIYVLALPYITGRISIDSEDYITNVRLISIGSSYAKRPYFQEGYLVKTEFTKHDKVSGELDFNRRLVAAYKFKNNKLFWGNESPIRKDYLYPPDDRMKDICESVKQFNTKEYLSSLESEDIVREFLNIWNLLEKSIKMPNRTFLQALKAKSKSDKNFQKYYDKIDGLRKFRNKLVHNTESISNLVLAEKLELLKSILIDLDMKNVYL